VPRRFAPLCVCLDFSTVRGPSLSEKDIGKKLKAKPYRFRGGAIRRGKGGRFGVDLRLRGGRFGVERGGRFGVDN